MIEVVDEEVLLEEPAEVEPLRRSSRRKLWEIPPSYLCSVVGTCLRVDEIRRRALKDKLCRTSISDYDLHGLMVGVCKSRSKTSRALHKSLDRRFSGMVRQASACKTPEQLRRFWKEALETGRVAEGYWALMTHPVVDAVLIEEAFGDIHMLSHVLGASRRAEVRQLDQALADAEELKRNLRALRRVLRAERAEREAIEASAAEQAAELERAQRRLDGLAGVEARITELQRITGLLDDQLQTEAQRREDLEQRLVRLQRRSQRQQRELNAVQAARDELADEVASAEDQILRLLADELPDAHEETETIDLQGACVLYVGGRTSLVRHYRRVVERCGGRFAHHDGGREESSTRLDDQVSLADIVVCAIDAVSHNASLRVKGACRNRARRFVPLRSSGVASLRVALRDLRFVGRGGPRPDDPTDVGSLGEA